MCVTSTRIRIEVLNILLSFLGHVCFLSLKSCSHVTNLFIHIMILVWGEMYWLLFSPKSKGITVFTGDVWRNLYPSISAKTNERQ